MKYSFEIMSEASNPGDLEFTLIESKEEKIDKSKNRQIEKFAHLDCLKQLFPPITVL